MKLLAVGGAGFLGSHLVDRALAEGHAVDVVDDLSSGSLANLAEARNAGGTLKIHTLDVMANEFAELVALRRPDVIYHLAWMPPGRCTAAAGGQAMAGTLQVLEAARTVGAKVVTCVPATALYGDVPPRDIPVKESHPWNPHGLHGVMSKAIIDVLQHYRDRHAVEFTVLAMATVYGCRQRPDGGVVAKLAAAVRNREPITVFGDGRQTRDLLFVDDAVDALVKAASKGGGLVVNVGSGVGTSILDLLSVLGATGAAVTTAPRPVDDIVRMAVSPTRARIQLAWAPWTDLAAGLRTL